MPFRLWPKPGGGGGGGTFPSVVASGEATWTVSSGDNAFQFAVAALTLPASHYVLSLEVHESPDGRANNTAGDSWQFQDAGFYGAVDASHAPTGIYAHVHRINGSASGYVLHLKYVVWQIN